MSWSIKNPIDPNDPIQLNHNKEIAAKCMEMHQCGTSSKDILKHMASVKNPYIYREEASCLCLPTCGYEEYKYEYSSYNFGLALVCICMFEHGAPLDVVKKMVALVPFKRTVVRKSYNSATGEAEFEVMSFKGLRKPTAN